MERVLIGDIKDYTDKDARVLGRVINTRKLGEAITFIIVQDYTGTIQTVWNKESDIKMGDAVDLTGKVIKDERAKGGYEIQGKEIKAISTSVEDYPFDLAKPELNLNLNTLLDYRPLSLRHTKVQAIFKLYDILLKAYETAMREEGFTEIKTPKILEVASEGGANFFELTYFEKKAYLAQSPQFYKQIMVGVFERVFEIGSTFRAEPHFTTRHVNEYISLDAEMGFIENYRDITTMLAKVLRRMFEMISREGEQYLKLYNTEVPVIPAEVPHVTLDEIKKIIKEKYDYEVPAETDIDPEGERLAGRYAKEKFNSDFIYITNYYWHDKPFYHMPSPDYNTTEGFDLIFRGMELVTGSQRIHDYKMLEENMKKKGISPKGMEDYLNTFKFALPPHGGWGMGSERLIQQLLGLGSIKEATLFPRDVKRLRP